MNIRGRHGEKIIKETCGNTFPRNIVAICDKLNICVKESQDLPDNVSGLIYKENNEYIILANANHSIGRKSFTIAHELSHYFLHRDKLENGGEIVSYLKSPFSEVIPALARCEIARTNEEYMKMEREANQLAADILMPEAEFLEKCLISD